MKKLLILLAIQFIFSNILFCQNLYSIKWIDRDITYSAILIYKNEDDAHLRVQFEDKEHNYQVWEMQCRYMDLNKNEEDKSTLALLFPSFEYVSYILVSETPKLIYQSKKDSTVAYSPDYFVWVKKKLNDNFTLLTFDDALIEYLQNSDNNSDISEFEKYCKTAKFVNAPKTTSFLREFYFTNEEEYLRFSKSFEDANKVVKNGNKFILISVNNTLDPKIGSGVKVDRDKIKSEFRQISEALGYTFEYNNIDDDNFGKPKLLSAIDNLTVSSSDVIVFYYRGHGFRWKDKKSSYPVLDLRNNNYYLCDENNSINFDDVLSKLNAKKPKGVLMLADCCNVTFNINEPTAAISSSWGLQLSPNYDIKKLQTLFNQLSGYCCIASASPNQVSWVNAVTGGFFTNSFFQNLDMMVSSDYSGEISWNQLFTITRKNALEKSSSDSDLHNKAKKLGLENGQQTAVFYTKKN